MRLTIDNVQIKPENIADLFENFSFLLDVGHPLYLAAKILADADCSKKDKSARGIAKAANILIDDLHDGYSLSQALENNKKYFGNMHGQIEAAEQAGKLSEALNRIAEQLRHSVKIKQKLQEAMLSPILTTIITLAITWYIFTAVIPDIFSQMESVGVLDMPTYTVIMLDIVEFLKQYQVVMLIAIITTIAIMLYLAKGPMKLMAHKLYSQMPIVSSITNDYNISNFYDSLSYMLFAGSSMDKSLEVAASGINNLYIKKQFDQAVNIYRSEGVDVYQALTVVNCMTVLELQTLSIGISANRFVEVLENLNSRRKAQLDKSLKLAIDLIGPITTIFLGIIFGFISIAVYTPLMNMSAMV